MKTVRVVAVYLAITEKTYHVNVPDGDEMTNAAIVTVAESTVEHRPSQAHLVKILSGEPVLEETYSTILP